MRRWRMVFMALCAILLMPGAFSPAAAHETSLDGEYGRIVEEQQARNAIFGLHGYDAEAISALERLAAETPRDWRPLHILAWVYAKQTEYNADRSLRERALEYALQARDLNPDDAVMYEILAASQFANGLFSEVEATLEKGLSLATSDEVRNNLFIQKLFWGWWSKILRGVQ